MLVLVHHVLPLVVDVPVLPLNHLFQTDHGVNHLPVIELLHCVLVDDPGLLPCEGVQGKELRHLLRPVQVGHCR